MNPERNARNGTGVFRPELDRNFRIRPEFKPGQKRRRFVPDFEVERAVPAGTERDSHLCCHLPLETHVATMPCNPFSHEIHHTRTSTPYLQVARGAYKLKKKQRNGNKERQEHKSTIRGHPPPYLAMLQIIYKMGEHWRKRGGNIGHWGKRKLENTVETVKTGKNEIYTDTQRISASPRLELHRR